MKAIDDTGAIAKGKHEGRMKEIDVHIKLIHINKNTYLVELWNI